MTTTTTKIFACGCNLAFGAHNRDYACGGTDGTQGTWCHVYRKHSARVRRAEFAYDLLRAAHRQARRNVESRA